MNYVITAWSFMFMTQMDVRYSLSNVIIMCRFLSKITATILSDSQRRERVLSTCDSSDVLRDAFSQTEASLSHQYEVFLLFFSVTFLKFSPCLSFPPLLFFSSSSLICVLLLYKWFFLAQSFLKMVNLTSLCANASGTLLLIYGYMLRDVNTRILYTSMA